MIEAIVDGRIDVGPLDSYSHDLLALHEPALAAQVRTLASTEGMPIPPLVATAALAPNELAGLRAALRRTPEEPSLAAPMARLLLAGFAFPSRPTTTVSPPSPPPTPRLRGSLMKRFLLALFVAVSAACPLFAQAQAWPAKPMHLVVPFPPGGPTDVLGRLVAQALGEATGQSVVVENKTGAAGNIGVAQIAKAAPDGTTFGIVPAGNIAVNPALYPDLPYKASELAPVTMLATVENVLVVNAEKVPAKNLKELLALATAKPGTLSYASPGAGSQAHLAGALLELDTGVQLIHVPYRGIAPAVNDLVGGQVSMMFAPFQTCCRTSSPASSARSASRA